MSCGSERSDLHAGTSSALGLSHLRGVPVTRQAATGVETDGSVLTHPFALIALQAVSLWPIWQWYARRLVEGADESWGLLALGVALVLL